MSHSAGIGYDVQEVTGGTDAPRSLEACHWTAANGATSQVQKHRDEVAYLEQDKQEGTPETHTHTAHSMDPVCRQIHTNSAPHPNTHACEDGLTHTDEHKPHSQLLTQDSPYMETANTPHTQPKDEGGGVEEKRRRNQNDERGEEEVESSEENHITVQVRS